MLSDISDIVHLVHTESTYTFQLLGYFLGLTIHSRFDGRRLLVCHCAQQLWGLIPLQSGSECGWQPNICAIYAWRIFLHAPSYPSPSCCLKAGEPLVPWRKAQMLPVLAVLVPAAVGDAGSDLLAQALPVDGVDCPRRKYSWDFYFWVSE